MDYPKNKISSQKIFKQKIVNQLVINFDPIPIDVHYLVLHYTSLDLTQTINRFNQKKSNASAHFVIDLDGSIYECVPALSPINGSLVEPFKAWHCGESLYHIYQNLNQYAIGIELVNRNGNLFQYSHRQYQSLIWLTQKLINKYKNLNNPNHIIGHEQIAGFRGKIDPGFYFDWIYFFKQVFVELKQLNLKKIKEISSNRATINPALLKSMQLSLGLNSNLSKQLNLKNPLWSYLNTWLEYSQKKIINHL